MASIQQILAPIVLTDVISQQMAAETWILNFMGFSPGGRNEKFFGHGRNGAFRVFNNTRQIGRGRAPGTAAAIARRQSVGEVQIVYPRMHEEIQLLAEEVHNLSKIDDPTTRDIAGLDYIRRQTQFAGQKAGNWRAAMTIGMLRDDLYVSVQGDDWYFNFTAAGSQFRINSNMPAGNRSQLDMLGAGDIIDQSWNNPNANIPAHLSNIDAAFQVLYGGRLEHVILRSAMWQNVINNDRVASQAGIAAAPFSTFARVVGERSDGTPLNVKTGQIAANPMVTFWITDEGLDIGAPGSETFTRYLPQNNAIFMPSPDIGIYSMQLGSEPIAEFDGGPETVRVGLSAWSKKASNPTATEIYNLDNALAINHIPNSTANGTVVFV